jgi:hypothetical protein
MRLDFVINTALSLKFAAMPKIFISYARDQSHGENLAAEAQQQLQAASKVILTLIGVLTDPEFQRLLKAFKTAYEADLV